MWGEVFSFFWDDSSLAELLLLSKRARAVIQNFTRVGVRVRRYQVQGWPLMASWLNNMKMLSYLEIGSTNCNSRDISSIIQACKDPKRGKRPDLSISKCFALTDSFVSEVENFKHIALCDVDLNQEIPLSFFIDLKTLILSNCTFDYGSLQNLFDNFPRQLTFVAFGGSRNLALSYDPLKAIALGKEPAVCDREDLCIEVTFLEANNLDFVKNMFPRATIMNLKNDSVDKLAAVQHRFKLNRNRSAVVRALASCHDKDNLGSTPLHIACRKGDAERCRWLLSLNCRVDLKDYKGCIPLHRAMPTAPILSLEPLVNNIQNRIASENNNTMTDVTPESRNKPFIISSTFSKDTTLQRSHVEEICDNESLPQPKFPSPGTFWHGTWQCAVLCLQAGADCFAKNQNLHTPIHVAAERANDVVLSSIISHLRRWKGEGDLLIDEKSSDVKGFTPLHTAILSQSLSCVRIMIAAGCCPNRQNSYGSTAMHLAYRSGIEEIIAEVKESGGSLEIKDFSGDLPESYSPQARKKVSKKSKHYKKTKLATAGQSNH
jgi:ankyrin repeat protein